jgi:hypothetical protein
LHKQRNRERASARAARSIHPCGSGVKDEDVCLTPKKHFSPARSWRAPRSSGFGRERERGRGVSASRSREPSGRRSSRQSRWVVPRRENLRRIPRTVPLVACVIARTSRAVCATKYSHCTQKCTLDFAAGGLNHLSAEVSFVCADPENFFNLL